MQRTLQRSLQRTGRGRDAETAREATLNAAEEVFARDGFSGARVDDIALNFDTLIRTSTAPRIWSETRSSGGVSPS